MVRRDPRTGRADRPRTDYTHRPVGRRGDHLGGARIWAERIGGVQSDHTRPRMGADVQLVDAGFGIGFKDSWTHALDQVRAAGGTPYPIPAF